MCVYPKQARRIRKKAICKAHEQWKGEAYSLYVEPLRGEVQRSRWTFYESVNLDYYDATTLTRGLWMGWKDLVNHGPWTSLLIGRSRTRSHGAGRPLTPYLVSENDTYTFYGTFFFTNPFLSVTDIVL